MSLRERRAERLRQLTRWAREIPGPLKQLHDRHGPTVHLRPTSSGVTLLGLTPGRPQRGSTKKFRDLGLLVRDFDALFEEHCRPEGQGRATPEKELQSALIRDAYGNQRRMAMVEAACGGAAVPVFVTDEIALPTGERSRIVCDLLCLQDHGDGTSSAVVMELKSARQKKELITQVETYAGLVEEQREGFEDLASALLERTTRFRPRCERYIVWPALRDGPDRHAAELLARGIRLLVYDENGGDLTIRSGLIG